LNDTRVRNYFDRIATDFDSIYDNKGSLLDKFVNFLFRKGMYERAITAVAECGDVTDKRILDIGCGSGRIALILAEKGANVVGIDYADSMIKLANNYLRKRDGKLKATFICGDFIKDIPTTKQFDITMALGVLDYLEDPSSFLRKMMAHTKGKMIVSYPAKFNMVTPIRKVWLTFKHCPVRFFSKSDINRLYKSLDISKYRIIELPRHTMIPTDYLVTTDFP